MPRQQTYRDVHADVPLSNVSLAHWQDTSVFVAGRFFPRVPVQHASNDYTTYPQGYFNRIYDTRRVEEGVANSVGYKTVDKKYSVGDDALRIFISKKKRANADPHRNLDAEATRVVTDALLLGKEKDFADNYLVNNVWTKTYSGVDSSPTGDQRLKWNDDSSDPVRQVKDAHVQFLLQGKRKANKGLMTFDTYMSVSEHPDIIDRVKYSGGVGNNNPSRVSVQALATLFELDEIMIMQSVYNTAFDGVEDSDGEPPETPDFIAKASFLMAYVEDSVGLFSPIAGATFAWNEYIAHEGMEAGPAVRRYPAVEGKKGDYIEAELAIDQKLISPDLGILFTSII